MLLTGSPVFQWVLSSTSGTRNTGDPFGTSVTPGNNTMGTYAEVLSDTQIAHDVWGIRISFNGNSVSTAARDTIVNIGVDAAGGTSYVTKIPNLLASSANQGVHHGIHYYFPLFIKAGSAIAAQASVNNATVGTLACWITVFGRPQHPELLRVGHVVDALGITAASSAGTAVTEGTTSDGAWTSLGTAPADWFYVQPGWGINNGTINASFHMVDLSRGGSGNEVVIVEDMYIGADTSERWGYDAASFAPACYVDIPSGTQMNARSQASGTAQTGMSAAVYGVRA